jgi:three-Cys-motif partner protein
MGSESVVWELDPHSKGKHLVLENYLKAWFPKLGMTRGRVLFVDGFAGPGEYVCGEEGSPLIALRVFCNHSARRKMGQVVFFFIEKDHARFKHLESLVARREPELPDNCRVRVRHGEFDETMTEALDSIDRQCTRLAPCFVMIDPFGVSGTPMNVIKRILRSPRSEVYVSLMYEFIDRFRGTGAFEAHLDRLFGCPSWRSGIAIDDGRKRREFFYGLYEHQLREAGAEYVVHFDLYRGNRLVYAIFFATQHLDGCNAMKEAIWAVDPWGEFEFHGSHSPQLNLGLTPRFIELRLALATRFGEREWVGIGEVEDFVKSDQVDFHLRQLRKQALVPMEKDGEIEVDPATRRRKRTYPQGTMLRFRPSAQFQDGRPLGGRG